jgi:hypothetical protein
MIAFSLLLPCVVEKHTRIELTRDNFNSIRARYGQRVGAQDDVVLRRKDNLRKQDLRSNHTILNIK